MFSLKKILTGIVGATMLFGISAPSNAHTIGFGTTAGAAAGSVSFYMMSYHTGMFAQGAITIGSQTVHFSSAGAGGADPDAALEFGTNWFYADGQGQT
jgi:hypothetical protein